MTARETRTVLEALAAEGAEVRFIGGSLIYTALTHGYDPTGTFVPPRWEGGRVVLGRVE